MAALKNDIRVIVFLDNPLKGGVVQAEISETGTSLALIRPALTYSNPTASSVGPEKPSTCICAASLHAATRLL
ncbi:hypothetical protein PAMP_013600 [Pampus punctatissimus]